MILTLYRDDLLPEYKLIPCAEAKFQHFTRDVRVAIIAAGGAVFQKDDRLNYKAILVPKDFKRGKRK